MPDVETVPGFIARFPMAETVALSAGQPDRMIALTK